MKNISQTYYSNLNQIDYPQMQEGKSENFFSEVFKINNNSYSYFQEIGNEIAVFYFNEFCTNTLQLANRSLKDDFIGLYYNLSPENSKIVFKIGPEIINAHEYNFLTINRFLEIEFGNKENEIAVFCIFVKKRVYSPTF